MDKLQLDEKTRVELRDFRKDKEYREKEKMWLNSERFDEHEL